MKNGCLIAVSVISLSVTLQSCFYNPVDKRQDSVFYSEPGTVVAEAEFLPDRGDSVKTVRVISNMSWIAHLNDKDHPVDPRTLEPVSWGNIDIYEHSNLSGTIDTVDVHIQFNRNRSQSAVHGALNFYGQGRLFFSVPVTQEGAVYRLSALSEKENVSCSSESVRIFIDCNTAWSARILDEETTADAHLSKDSGVDRDTISVSFAENYDALSSKVAKLLLQATDCPDVTLTVNQDRAVPYILIIRDKIEPELKPGLASGALTFRTNCAWTVSAENLAGVCEFKDLVFSETSGGPVTGEKTVTFTYVNAADDPHLVGGVKVILQAEACDPESIQYTQRGVLACNFDVYSPENPPYGLPTSKGEVFSITVDTSVSSYVFKGNNTLYRAKSDSYGLQIPQDGHFVVPGIEGMKLTHIIAAFKYHSSFKKLRLLACDEDDSKICYSGVLNNYAITEDWEHAYVIGYITEPEVKSGDNLAKLPAGRGCDLYCSTNTNNLLGSLKLVYEPVDAE